MFEPLSNEELLQLTTIIFRYLPNEIQNRELKILIKRNHILYKGTIYENPELVRRLFENLKVDQDRGCWFKSKLHKSEYRKIHAYGKILQAHRVSYRIMRNNWDQTKFVCHFCDTPQCINFNHLFLGTPSENQRDSIRKYPKRPRKPKIMEPVNKTDQIIREIESIRREYHETTIYFPPKNFV